MSCQQQRYDNADETSGAGADKSSKSLFVVRLPAYASGKPGDLNDIGKQQSCAQACDAIQQISGGIWDGTHEQRESDRASEHEQKRLQGTLFNLTDL
jgi:hypothetical protein